MRIRWLFFAWMGIAAIAACRTNVITPQHGWWEGNGVVVPHHTFPTDCELCHVGERWRDLAPDFEFDHGAETGHELHGAHESAQCLRCHNDRGPVEVFAAQGCAGCHQDPHMGRLGTSCADCHGEYTWRPNGMLEAHARSRFPLTGAHRTTECRRCHTGSEVGVFTPVSTACADCHQDDLARALTPDHQALGFVDNCHRCHRPTVWEDAENN